MSNAPRPDEFLPPRRKGGVPWLRRWWQRCRSQVPAVPYWSPDWDLLMAIVLPGSVPWRAGQRGRAVRLFAVWLLLALCGWWLCGTPLEFVFMTGAILVHLVAARRVLFPPGSARLTHAVVAAMLLTLYAVGWNYISAPVYEVRYAMRNLLPAPLIKIDDRVMLAGGDCPIGALVMFSPGRSLELERGHLVFYGQTFGRVVASPGSADAAAVVAALAPYRLPAAAPLLVTDAQVREITGRLPVPGDRMLVLAWVGSGGQENNLRTTRTILSVPITAVDGRVARIVWPWSRRRVV